MAFTLREIAQIKRTAQNVAPMIAKREKLLTKMMTLEDEVTALDHQIDAWEMGVKAITGGYTSSDLIDRVVNISTTTEGKEIKAVNYVLKYPDTILPPVEQEVTTCQAATGEPDYPTSILPPDVDEVDNKVDEAFNPFN